MAYWAPESEEELLRALADGTVDESHYLDFKRESGSNERARKESAVDLASFALDGGVLIFGVDEPTPGSFVPYPIALENLSEKIEQIAANSVDPGLHIRTRAIPSAADPTLGYLVVEVPPSPGAPHMVDGRYWGRNEKTKQRLSDPDVRRLIVGKEGIESRVRTALAESEKTAPQPPPRARLHLVAIPQAAPEGAASTFVRQRPEVMIDFANSGDGRVPPGLRPFVEDSWTYRGAVVRRLHALARTTLNAQKQAADYAATEYAADLEVRTSGEVHLLLSSIWGEERSRYDPEKPRYILYDHTISAAAFRIIGLAERIANETGYRGPWAFGLLMAGGYGMEAAREVTFQSRHTQVTETRYQKSVTASFSEIESDPGSIVSRLLLDLWVALGVADDFEAIIAPPTAKD